MVEKKRSAAPTSAPATGTLPDQRPEPSHKRLKAGDLGGAWVPSSWRVKDEESEEPGTFGGSGSSWTELDGLLEEAQEDEQEDVVLPGDGDYSKDYFLPAAIRGSTILLQQDSGLFRLDNSELQSQGSGVGYRLSKDLSDKDPDPEAFMAWDTEFEGTDVGDGWVKVETLLGSHAKDPAAAGPQPPAFPPPPEAYAASASSRAPRTSKAGATATVFVGNLPYDTSEEELWTICGAVGQVNNVRIVRDKDTNKPRGIAFVDFVDAETASRACGDLTDADCGGRKLRVSLSDKEPTKPGRAGMTPAPKWGARQAAGSGDRGPTLDAPPGNWETTVKSGSLASKEQVKRVKEVQKASQAWRDEWERLCTTEGGGIYEPSRQTATFVQAFLDNVDADTDVEAPSGLATEEQVERVRRDSRSSAQFKEAWERFCDAEAGPKRRDPARHNADFVQRFLDNVDTGVIVIPPEPRRKMELCRFGLQCKRVDCFYLHPEAEDGTTTKPQKASPCLFGRNCKRVGCFFDHPDGRLIDENPEAAMCKFGMLCTRPDCFYKHPPEKDGEEFCLYLDEVPMHARPEVAPASTDREVFVDPLPGLEGSEELEFFLSYFAGGAEDLFILPGQDRGYVRFKTHEDAEMCVANEAGKWSESERAQSSRGRKAQSLWRRGMNSAYPDSLTDLIRGKDGQNLKDLMHKTGVKWLKMMANENVSDELNDMSNRVHLRGRATPDNFQHLKCEVEVLLGRAHEHLGRMLERRRQQQEEKRQEMAVKKEAREQEQERKKPRTLVVDGVPADWGQDEVDGLFSAFGDVEQAEVLEDGITEVTFCKSADAERALQELHGMALSKSEEARALQVEMLSSGEAAGLGDANEDGDDFNCVWIGNVSWDATEEEVREFCNCAGPVTDVRLMKGYAFVEFGERCDWQRLKMLQNHKLKDRWLKVDLAKKQQAHSLKRKRDAAELEDERRMGDIQREKRTLALNEDLAWHAASIETVRVEGFENGNMPPAKAAKAVEVPAAMQKNFRQLPAAFQAPAAFQQQEAAWGNAATSADGSWGSAATSVDGSWGSAAQSADGAWGNVVAGADGSWVSAATGQLMGQLMGNAAMSADGSWGSAATGADGSWGSAATGADGSWGSAATGADGSWGNAVTGADGSWGNAVASADGSWGSATTSASRQSAWDQGPHGIIMSPGRTNQQGFVPKQGLTPNKQGLMLSQQATMAQMAAAMQMYMAQDNKRQRLS